MKKKNKKKKNFIFIFIKKIPLKNQKNPQNKK